MQNDNIMEIEINIEEKGFLVQKKDEIALIRQDFDSKNIILNLKNLPYYIHTIENERADFSKMLSLFYEGYQNPELLYLISNGVSFEFVSHKELKNKVKVWENNLS